MACRRAHSQSRCRVAVKFFLWLACRSAAVSQNSDTLSALAEDHINDVWSNTAAVVTGALASRFRSVWWLDPAAGIVISVLIIGRWVGVTNEQVKKIAGHIAPPEFVEIVQDLALQHEARLAIDVTRAYHFGSRFNVEMEIVLPADMTVAESHDIGLALQHKVWLLRLALRSLALQPSRNARRLKSWMTWSDASSTSTTRSAISPSRNTRWRGSCCSHATRRRLRSPAAPSRTAYQGHRRCSE